MSEDRWRTLRGACLLACVPATALLGFTCAIEAGHPGSYLYMVGVAGLVVAGLTIGCITTVPLPRPPAALGRCEHGDPTCPCRDGDPCHYEPRDGTPALTCPFPGCQVASPHERVAPWPTTEAEMPTPVQVAARLAACDPTTRVAWVRWAQRASEEALRCFVENHHQTRVGR